MKKNIYTIASVIGTIIGSNDSLSKQVNSKFIVIFSFAIFSNLKINVYELNIFAPYCAFIMNWKVPEQIIAIFLPLISMRPSSFFPILRLLDPLILLR